MFRLKKSKFKKNKKERVPAFIWVLMLVAAIFGLFLTRHCHKQLDEYLVVENIELEQKATAFARISFEIKNLASFKIKRRVITRLYQGNLELGSKMIMAEIEGQKTAGYFVTINFVKPLTAGEEIDEISVKFYGI